MTIVDPKKYERAAKRAIDKEARSISEVSPSSDFFDAFLHLERLVRDYLGRKELYVPIRGAPRMSYSFRQMLEALRMNEKIDNNFYSELLEINKYRNLVFHGHVSQVDAGMVQRVRAAAQTIGHLK